MWIVARMGAAVALGLFVAASAWAQTAGGPRAATPVAPVPAATVVAQAPTAGPAATVVAPAPTAGPVAATVPAAAAQAPALSDATLRALKDRRVSLATGPGTVVTGKLLGFEADSITLATDDGTPVTVSRAQITTLRLAEKPAGASAPIVTAPRVEPPDDEARASDTEPPSKGAPRYFGIHLGMAPGVAFDVDYGYFHGFASTSLLMPLASSGQMFAFTFGAGPSFALTDRWRFDLFAHIAPMFWQQYYFSSNGSGSLRIEPFVGIGVGMGFHYTAPTGWCVGINLPVLGGAVGNYGLYNSSVGQTAGYYYLASAMSLAGFSFGYRF